MRTGLGNSTVSTLKDMHQTEFSLIVTVQSDVKLSRMYPYPLA